MADRAPIFPSRRAPGPAGPALRRAPVPVAALTVSAIAHGLAAAVIVALILWGGWRATRVHVVNLVPTVAAVGLPARDRAPDLPRRPEALPTTARAATRELTPREARQREAPPALPAASLPAPRELPRPAALPRPGVKELPPLASPGEERRPPARAPAGEPAEARPAPPPPVGQITGSLTGTGALTLDVTDFPHAWYLRQVLQKVEQSWQRQGQQAEPRDKPLVLVEIQRGGAIAPPHIEKSSGNALYDQAALRAIADASPFPPLPADWTRPTLRVLFRFELRGQKG